MRSPIHRIDTRPSVLVIDDDTSFCEALSILLSDDFHVITATTGAEGLALLSHVPIALVLLDIGLPDMHGLEVLQHLKRQAPATAVVIVSAVLDSAVIDAALQGGALDFLSKPCDDTLLCSRIHRALAPAAP